MPQTWMRRLSFLAVVSGIISTVLLVGCGGDDATTEADSANNAATTATATVRPD